MENKTYNPAEPVAITLTMEEWQTVLHWLEEGTGHHMCKRAEVLANCKDHRIAAKLVAAHETAAAEAENVRKIIEATLYPAPSPETCAKSSTPTI